jgi:hypothetical protein
MGFFNQVINAFDPKAPGSFISGIKNTASDTKQGFRDGSEIQDKNLPEPDPVMKILPYVVIIGGISGAVIFFL